MPLVDLPLPQLQEYRPSPTREPDFDAFWEGTLAEASRIPLEIEVEPVADYPVPGLRLARVRYSGWAGSRICAWWLVPPRPTPGACDGRRPAMVFYHGYGGSKGGADLYLGWALQGYCVLAVDTRASPARAAIPALPRGARHGVHDPGRAQPGGLLLPRGLRGLPAGPGRPGRPARGRSLPHRPHRGQPGGRPDPGRRRPRPAAAGPSGHAGRALPLPLPAGGGRGLGAPYTEIAGYCRTWPQREGEVFRTLSYFDNMNLAPRVTCPVLISVGLQDVCCPPLHHLRRLQPPGSAEQGEGDQGLPLQRPRGEPHPRPGQAALGPGAWSSTPEMRTPISPAPGCRSPGGAARHACPAPAGARRAVRKAFCPSGDNLRRYRARAAPTEHAPGPLWWWMCPR